MSDEARKLAPPPPPSVGERDRSAGPAGDPSRDDRAGASPGGDDTSRVDGIDRLEFRRGLNDLHRAITAEGVNTRQFIGWLLGTFGLLALVLGVYCIYSDDGGWG